MSDTTFPENCPTCLSQRQDMKMLYTVPLGVSLCEDPWHECAPARERTDWTLAEQSLHQRIGARRRQDLIIHLKVMQLRLGFERNLPYSVLRQQADDLGELIESYNDMEARHAEGARPTRAGDSDRPTAGGHQSGPAHGGGRGAP